MMEAIRKFSTSFIGKIVFVLVLLAFGSGFWYFGNPFGGGEENWVARVGGEDIPPQLVVNAYQRELNRLRAAGTSIDSERAREIGLPQRVLGQIIDRTLLDLAIADLGLAAGDDEVRAAIIANPAFHGPGGGFDRARYRETLRAAGFSEQGYEQSVRHNLLRAAYIGSLQAAIRPPRVMVEALYRFQHERRTAEALRIADADIADIAKPDQAALMAFYREHQDMFTAPEYRRLTAIILRVNDLIGEMAVSDEALRAAYEERADEFSQPERRTLKQMVLPDRESAEKAYRRIKEGADFAAVAKELAGLDPGALDVGTVTKNELIPDLAAAAFSLPEGGVSEPVKSPLGWHLIKVVRIEPARVKSFEEVKKQLAAELAREKAVDALFDLSNRLDDVIGGGAALEDGAAQLGLKLRRIEAIDAEGRDPNGKTIADLPAGLVKTAFDTPERGDSLLTEGGDDSYFIVRVDKVIPPAVKPFAAVRDAVVQALLADRRAAAGKKKAEAAAEALKAGKPLAEVASAEGAAVLTAKPFDRSEAGAGLPKKLVGTLFAARPGEPVVVRIGDAFYVGRVKSVIAADPNTDPAGVEQLERQLARMVDRDLLDQLVSTLRRQHAVEINTRLFQQLF